MLEIWKRSPEGEDEEFVRLCSSEREAREFVQTMAYAMCLPRNKKGQFISPYSVIRG
jgi:hypothetical protein